jgi:hypothetical protein
MQKSYLTVVLTVTGMKRATGSNYCGTQAGLHGLP